VKVSSDILLGPSELTPIELRQLFKKLAFLDGEQNEVKPYRVERGGQIRLPRGAWALLPDHVRYHDDRIRPIRLDALGFDLELDAEGFSGQKAALEAIMQEEQGLVIAQPGFGKTAVALAAFHESQTTALVLVHTEDIFNQWVGYIKRYMPDADVGTIQGSQWRLGDITVGMVQTITRQMTRYRRLAHRFGMVIVDETHHAPAESWEKILNETPAHYRLGFTATESRADGMHPLMRHLIGPVIFKQAFELKVPTKIIPLKSGFQFTYRGRYDWGRLQDALIKNDDRNALIAKTIARQMKKGHSCLVLSRRIEHLEQIHEHLRLALDFDEGWIQLVTTLTGQVPKPRRLKMLKDFRAGEIKCILATQLADEALDVPILSRVFLTYPGKHDGRIIQQVGRALREHDEKNDALIFDVVDDRIGPLRRQWMERKQTYGKLGIKIVRKPNEEDNYVSSAARRRVVSDRIRKRLRTRMGSARNAGRKRP
jgi:superfamily II DNA or RNA helicase